VPKGDDWALKAKFDACVSWAGTGDPPPCARAPGASAWASSRNSAHLRCAGPSEGDARRPRRGRRAPGRQPGRCPARMSAPPLGRRRALREICMRWLGRFALEHSQRPVGASARPTESRSEGPASRTQSRAVGRTALCGRVVSAFAWLRLWRRSSSRARSTLLLPHESERGRRNDWVSRPLRSRWFGLS
jgi:hypothetical protein